VCLGNSLARLEASAAFPRLLARFPGLAHDPDPDTGHAGRPTRRDRLVLRGYQSLPIRLA
jgi:cytochrome P450